MAADRAKPTAVYPRPSAADPAPAPVVPSPRLPQVEESILAFWKRDKTFEASVQQRDGCEEWVFYDGPPFANGLPHYGHLLTGYAKDVFPRYQTMRGKQVPRRFGWDTHGLPAELEAMKQLGITTKAEIERMGIAAFNAAARRSVLVYTQEWQDYVTRQARWVDFEHDYKTLDPTFMESVLWAFEQLWNKGLAYEGYRVLPYCWNDETPLSNHELRMDDEVYQERQDQSVTVTFPLTGARAAELGLEGVRALAWTTTPWTLPTNEALAVGPDIEYVVIPAGEGASDAVEGSSALLASALVGSYARELGYATAADALAAVTKTVTGRELEGVEYERLYDLYADAATWGTETAWRILVDDFVTTGDGTGLVHMSPAYGEDDKRVCDAAGIPTIVSVDDGGRFLPMLQSAFPEGGVAGELWMDANSAIIRSLRASARLLQQKSYLHSFPHCWRCKQPLIYKAVSSWFVKVTGLKNDMLRLNEQITWVPENVKYGQFGKWLENARDWSISRNRFWGSPIPVWKSDDPAYPRVDVYGSLAALERDFGRLPVDEHGAVDLHRPYIDELTRPNPDDPSGRSTMRRIEDVFDVWFDSGSMPYAQVHYPFENESWFDSHNPADFIVEYIGQTRGWFYVMHVLATALFDRPAFSNVISHGIVLGNDGQKMSKSLRNYPDVNEVFDRDGSDAMRWFLMSSSVIRGGNLVVTEEGIREGARQFLLPLWSTWYFFTLYANAAGVEATRSTASGDVLDRYLLAKTGDLIRDVQQQLDALDAPLATAAVRDFAQMLTNWYVRRSRDRFWSGEDRSAFDTLFTVLETLTRVAAPLAPLVSESVWQGLTGGRSVHLTDWPDADEFPGDPELVDAMDRVREIASTVLAVRKAHGLRVRLPLARLDVVVKDSGALVPYLDLLADEVNVKHVGVTELEADTAQSYGIERRLSVNARAAGPRLGKQVQQVIAAAKAGDWAVVGGVMTVGGLALEEGEYELALDAAAGAASGAGVALLPGDDGGFVRLDLEVTDELAAEGLARDLVRAVQEARRSAGLDVSDRIDLRVHAADLSDAAAFDAHRDMIAAEVLAVHLTIGAGTDPEAAAAVSAPAGGYRATVDAGQYANAGRIVIDLAATGAVHV